MHENQGCTFVSKCFLYEESMASCVLFSSVTSVLQTDCCKEVYVYHIGIFFFRYDICNVFVGM